MEVLRMNYYFTGLIILALTMLALFVEPAYPRNEYLNEYGVRCGEVDFRIEDRNNTQDYHTYNSNDYDNDSQNFSITFRKYLGTDCKTSKENVAIKQQLELMKMCGRVNANPSLANNSNFNLLVSKCRGVIPTEVEEARPAEKNTWKGMKKDYLKDNPDAKTMDNTTLKMPPKNFILPKPKPNE